MCVKCLSGIIFIVSVIWVHTMVLQDGVNLLYFEVDILAVLLQGGGMNPFFAI